MPGAVTRPLRVIKVTHNWCMLEWQECSEDGGSPVIEYLVEKKEDLGDGEVWKVASKSATTQAVVKGLVASRSYRFAVRAKNIHGVSQASPPTESISIKQIIRRQASEYDKYGGLTIRFSKV